MGSGRMLMHVGEARGEAMADGSAFLPGCGPWRESRLRLPCPLRWPGSVSQAPAFSRSLTAGRSPGKASGIICAKLHRSHPNKTRRSLTSQKFGSWLRRRIRRRREWTALWVTQQEGRSSSGTGQSWTRASLRRRAAPSLTSPSPVTVPFPPPRQAHSLHGECPSSFWVETAPWHLWGATRPEGSLCSQAGCTEAGTAHRVETLEPLQSASHPSVAHPPAPSLPPRVPGPLPLDTQLAPAWLHSAPAACRPKPWCTWAAFLNLS